MKPESILAHEPKVLTQAQRETNFNDVPMDVLLGEEYNAKRRN